MHMMLTSSMYEVSVVVVFSDGSGSSSITFAYKRNRAGDSGEPCGRPPSNGFWTSVWLLKQNAIVRSVQKEDTHFVR